MINEEKSVELEYEYIFKEIHLRLEFNRRILLILIGFLTAASTTTVTILSSSIKIDSMVVGYGCSAVCFLTYTLVVEARQNSLHTIISGNYLLEMYEKHFSKGYIAKSSGYLYSLRYKRSEAFRSYVLNYVDSFILIPWGIVLLADYLFYAAKIDYAAHFYAPIILLGIMHLLMLRISALHIYFDPQIGKKATNLYAQKLENMRSNSSAAK